MLLPHFDRGGDFGGVSPDLSLKTGIFGDFGQNLQFSNETRGKNLQFSNETRGNFL